MPCRWRGVSETPEARSYEVMSDEEPKKFESDAFLEKLLILRARDPAQFSAYPEELKRIVYEYEKEKQAASDES